MIWGYSSDTGKLQVDVRPIFMEKPGEPGDLFSLDTANTDPWDPRTGAPGAPGAPLIRPAIDYGKLDEMAREKSKSVLL